MVREQILQLFRGRLRNALESLELDFEKVQEIRLRVHRPVIIQQNGNEIFLNEPVNEKDLKGIVEVLCGYSGYAYEEEIQRGYVTMAGGHRVGLAGRAVMNAAGVQTLKYISALNIRVAHPVNGCAEKWIEYFYKEKSPCHVLIISPPGCGKTTLLRDAVRLLSDGVAGHQGVTVGVVDERSEIAGTCRGIAAHDLGMRTDVLDGCPKAIGMEILLRSMSPRVLAVDEIGTEDVASIESALRCGCKVVATLHGEKLADYLEKPGFEKLVKARVFERYIFLKEGQELGTVAVIYGKNFETLWEEGKCT